MKSYQIALMFVAKLTKLNWVEDEKLRFSFSKICLMEVGTATYS